MSIKIGQKDTLVPTIPQAPDNPKQADSFVDQGYTNANDVGLQTSGLGITDGSKIIGKGGSKVKVITGITPDFNKPPINVGKENVPITFPGQTVAFANDPGIVKRQTDWSTDNMKNMAMMKSKKAMEKRPPSMRR